MWPFLAAADGGDRSRASPSQGDTGEDNGGTNENVWGQCLAEHQGTEGDGHDGEQVGDDRGTGGP
jgi:hypothetical protein